MNNKNKKCSLVENNENDAVCFCQECKIYMCNKCENFHSALFKNHHSFKLDKDITEIFTGFCKEKNHYYDKLTYFCKVHNKLCCAACVTKIKGEGNGQHTDCDICFIKDNKEEKKNKLNANIKILEDLSNSLEKAINGLKIIFAKIMENKEELKQNIQKIFTKIRNVLNDREDELLIEVDKQFDKLYCSEDLIVKNEKLPNKIKISLEKGKIIEPEWNDNNKLNLLINDCINIENNINYYNEITENIKKIKANNNKIIKFIPEENGINEFIAKIKVFGKIYHNNFKFKECPNNINEKRKYVVSGENQNILTKVGTDHNWMGTICENELEKGKEHKWKIKIIKNRYNNIMVGVAPINFDINSSLYNNCGWYFFFCNCLYSGPPHNYKEKSANLTEIKDINDEIVVVMNMVKGTLKFIINNEDKGDSYANIPLDKPLVPAVFLYDINDSVEIIEC